MTDGRRKKANSHPRVNILNPGTKIKENKLTKEGFSKIKGSRSSKLISKSFNINDKKISNKKGKKSRTVR